MKYLAIIVNLTIGVGAAISTGIMLMFGLIGRERGGSPQLELSALFFGIFLLCLAIDWIIRPRGQEEDSALSEKWLRQARSLRRVRIRLRRTRAMKTLSVLLTAGSMVPGILMVKNDPDAANFLANLATELALVVAASLLIAVAVALRGKNK